jgi:hypothetical protein
VGKRRLMHVTGRLRSYSSIAKGRRAAAAEVSGRGIDKGRKFRVLAGRWHRIGKIVGEVERDFYCNFVMAIPTGLNITRRSRSPYTWFRLGEGSTSPSRRPWRSCRVGAAGGGTAWRFGFSAGLEPAGATKGQRRSFIFPRRPLGPSLFRTSESPPAVGRSSGM